MESRSRFLQLRLRELAGQEEHYQAELDRLRQQQQQPGANPLQKAAASAEPALTAAEGQQAFPAVGAPASAPEPELKQENKLAAEEGILSSAQPSPRQQGSAVAGQAPLQASASLGDRPAWLRRSQRRRKQERLHAPDLVPATLLRHPMFAALAGVRNPSKVLPPPVRGAFVQTYIPGSKLFLTLPATTRLAE